MAPPQPTWRYHRTTDPLSSEFNAERFVEEYGDNNLITCQALLDFRAAATANEIAVRAFELNLCTLKQMVSIRRMPYDMVRTGQLVYVYDGSLGPGATFWFPGAPVPTPPPPPPPKRRLVKKKSPPPPPPSRRLVKKKSPP